MKIYKLFLIAVIAGIMPVCAQDKPQGLKDVYKDLFRMGTILNGTTSNSQAMKDLVLKEFNSITPENELKPDQTMVQSGSTDEDIKVQLNAGAKRILKFCEDNNIGLRGHTLVWHGQTPPWFFRANIHSKPHTWDDKLTAGDVLADAETMNKRMESYIKNIFALIQKDYPNLNLYAYDVVNEALNDNGSLRNAGIGDGQSPWTQIYGSDQFIINAFTYSRKYAPAGCKLFYNDYNEFVATKRDAIYKLAMKLQAENLIDGIGMQSHLGSGSPGANLYGQAVAKFASTGLEVQITEMDIDVSNNDFAAQGRRYKEIMSKILEHKESVTAFVVWGIQDNQSWRGSTAAPLLFDANGERKPAYDELYFLASGTYPPGTEPDGDGYYFFNTFENATTQSWTNRGNAKVTSTTRYAYEGKRSMFVSGRTAYWHGAERSIDYKTFVPGNTYSFGAMVMYSTGDEKGTFKLTLHYGVDGKNYYNTIAQASAVKGEWVELLNADCNIPDNASNMHLYIEMSDQLVDFHIDRAFGAIAGKGGITSVPVLQSGNSLKAWTDGNLLQITGIPEGKPWRVYTATGILVHQGIAVETLCTTSLQQQGVYIVWTEQGKVKVIF